MNDVVNQVASIVKSIRSDVALLTSKMNEGKLKPSEIKLMNMAVAMICSDNPLTSDLAAAAAIISTIADGYRRQLAGLHAIEGRIQ